MDSDQRRKRKRGTRANFVSFKSLLLLLAFVFLVFLLTHRFPIDAASFRPVLGSRFLYSSSSAATSNSLLDAHAAKRQDYALSFPPRRVLDRVVFPDQVLVFFTPDPVPAPESLECVYGGQSGFDVKPVISLDRYDRFRSVARCPLPPGNFSRVDLRRKGGSYPGRPAAASSWERLVYEAEVDGDTVVVFVKGLNLRQHHRYDPVRFRCRFGQKRPKAENKSDGFILYTPAIAAAQEVVRCALPESIQLNPEKTKGLRVSVSTMPDGVTLPSVARIFRSVSDDKPRESFEKKHELCACTMVWNQATALKEWITYHSWLGVDKWFVYDNNSDDGTDNVLRELDNQGLNVTRRVWPWIKTQEAGFSHCALTVRDQCKWVGFFDVDEYFYLPRGPGRNGLSSLVANISATSEKVGEIRTECHSFGPSGLSSAPAKGVTVGYNCRLKNPERHKSIVRPELLDATLLNAVHHFRLREGFRYVNMPKSKAMVNHYKFQVWEKFRAKFFRRVATYVVDWQEDQNKGSKDRAPGLGTEAIEPPNWKELFCEVKDNRLRDLVLKHFRDPENGLLPWEEERSPAAQT